MAPTPSRVSWWNTSATSATAGIPATGRPVFEKPTSRAARPPITSETGAYSIAGAKVEWVAKSMGALIGMQRQSLLTGL